MVQWVFVVGLSCKAPAKLGVKAGSSWQDVPLMESFSPPCLMLLCPLTSLFCFFSLHCPLYSTSFSFLHSWHLPPGLQSPHLPVTHDPDGTCPPATRLSSRSLAAIPGGLHLSLGRGLISVCEDSSEALTRMPVRWCKQRAACRDEILASLLAYRTVAGLL